MAGYSQRVGRGSSRLAFTLYAAMLTAIACLPVRLVSEYDERVDQEATRLQRAMDEFLTQAEHTPSGDPTRTYAFSTPFYVRYAVDLRALKTRAIARQRNSITVQQITLMESNVERLRALHQSQNTLSTAATATFRDLFNTAWTSILTFELAKKR